MTELKLFSLKLALNFKKNKNFFYQKCKINFLFLKKIIFEGFNMKGIKRIFIFISLSFFGSSAYLLEGIAVIDYNAIFLGTDLARERIDDLRESSDYKDLTDEAQSKDSERIKLAEKLQKEDSTLSDSEKEDILKKIQTLYQSIQLLSQQIQAKEQEVTQKLQADQAEVVQKVVNELIKAKNIKLLLNSQALLAFDRSDEKINLTPEVVDLINKEQKK
tara:strand:- start:444 stop:1097 length:654 start_codon:yes stop_codon:yes gene_type:complete